MITLKEIHKRSMTDEKKSSAKNDIFAYYIGRPISYLFTWPFLYTKISPNAITVLSMIFVIFGFVFTSFNRGPIFLLIGWIMFFLWNLFDGVDGNIARYRKEFSVNGAVFDATGGYLAMYFTFFSYGIAAFNFGGYITNTFSIPSYIYIILGSISGFSLIFPRLVMHKKKSTVKNESKSVEEMQNKANYGFIRIVILNITSISGFVQLFMLVICILSFFSIYLFDIFTIGYCFVNIIFMMITLFKLLGKE